jgi:hypothetical protein
MEAAMTEGPPLTSPAWRARIATALAILPLVVTGIRAAASSWVPIGDDAYFTARSMDVATAHHPLLGAWSSGSAGISRQVNNLGPLQLDLLAPFTKIAPMGGTAIGVVVVHIAAVITIGWSVRRLAGPEAVLPAMAAVSVLTWLLGSEMLIAARQHQYLVLPYLCVLVAAWAATAGERWALVPFVVAGSLATQTHLSYPILVAGLGIPVIAGQIWAARQRGLTEYRRPWTVAIGLAIVLWLQTAIDQFAGWGNLTAALSSPGEASSPGLMGGVRIVAHVVVAARGFVRPGFAQWDPDVGIAGDIRVSLFLLLSLGLVLSVIVAIRLRRRIAAAGLLVAVVALAGAVIDAASLPITQFGLTGLSSANYRWLWSTTTFLLLGGLLALAHYVSTTTDRGRSISTLGFSVFLVVAVAANLPSSQQVPRPDLYREQLRVTTELVEQLRHVDLNGPVLVDQSHLYFGHPFGYPTVVVLQDRGIEYRLEGSMQQRRFGESRVADGTERQRLVLWRGDEALERVDAPNRVVYVDGYDPLVVLLETEENG